MMYLLFTIIIAGGSILAFFAVLDLFRHEQDKREFRKYEEEQLKRRNKSFNTGIHVIVHGRPPVKNKVPKLANIGQH